MAPLVQERVKTLAEVPAYVDFFFLDELPVDEAAWAKTMKDGAAAVLDEAIAVLETADWSAEALKSLIETVGAGHGLNKSKAQAPMRVAVTGRTVGPPLYDSLELLGREETLGRLRAARARI